MKSSPGAPAPPEQAPAIDPRWAACLDYNPANKTEHMQRCLAGKTAGLQTCAALISLYENQLRAAYGGSFPLGYVRPTCADARPIIEAENLVVAEHQRHGINDGRDPHNPLEPTWRFPRQISISPSPKFFAYEDNTVGDKADELAKYDRSIQQTTGQRCLGRAAIRGTEHGNTAVFSDLPAGQNVISISCTGQCDDIKYGVGADHSTVIYHRGASTLFPEIVSQGRRFGRSVTIGLVFFTDIGDADPELIFGKDFELPADTTIVVEHRAHTLAALFRSAGKCSHSTRSSLR
jgi:hypothetical protein